MILRAVALALALLAACKTADDGALLELRIVQDTDLIRNSRFGRPAQIAVWLENPVDGSMKTLFVSECSGTGVWRGKSECPASLPRWFAVYRRETGQDGYPRPDAPAPDGVTRPTPTGAAFEWTAEIPPGHGWIGWIEVNLSGDFNERFVQVDEATGITDTDSSGQPSLLYRAEIELDSTSRARPVLFGRTVPRAMGEMTRDLEGITTARDILESLEIRILPR